MSLQQLYEAITALTERHPSLAAERGRLLGVLRTHSDGLLRLGFSDPSKLTTEHYNGETGEEGWLRYHVWCNERALDVAEQRVVIMDLANLSKWHLAPGALASLQRMVGLDRRHYPGTVKAYLVLN